MENEYIKFWFEDGILCSEYKIPYNMDLEDSKKIYELREKISGDEDQFFCYDISNLRSMSKEARVYGSKYGMNKIAASAVIVNSYLTMLLYNVFLNLHKVDIPVKAFKNKEEAIIWLKKVKETNGTK
jgi:hypothetical protein